MLELSLDSTNPINICQEELYHLTTAGNKVSVLLLPSCSFFNLSFLKMTLVLKLLINFHKVLLYVNQ